MKRALLGTLVVALVATVAMPPASAQLPAGPSPGQTTLIVSLLDPGFGFPPGGSGDVQVLVTYQWPNGAAPQPSPTPEVAENTTPTEITLTAKQLPSWVESATFVPEKLYAKIPLDKQATASSTSLAANVTLKIRPDAPALTREDLVVAGDSSANGNLAAAHGESAPIKLRVAPVGKVNVTSAPQAIIPGGRWTTITYQVKNEGNTDLVAKLNVTVKPENSEVEFPKSLTLAKNSTVPVEVRIRTPWTNAELGTLTLEAIPIVDGTDGKTSSFDVDVRGESAVPFLGPVGLLSLVGLLALLHRSQALRR